MPESTENWLSNGKGKLVAGVVTTALLGLQVWIFSTVNSLQVTVGKLEDRITTLRGEFDAQRNVENAFQAETRANATSAQAEMRSNLQTAQAEMRLSIQRVGDILTQVQIHLGGSVGLLDPQRRK